jgi:hypothetical protein
MAIGHRHVAFCGKPGHLFTMEQLTSDFRHQSVREVLLNGLEGPSP